MSKKDPQAETDLQLYLKFMKLNNFHMALMIEKKYNLDGYPPDIVTMALGAKANGKNMYTALDQAMGL